MLNLRVLCSVVNITACREVVKEKVFIFFLCLAVAVSGVELALLLGLVAVMFFPFLGTIER
jgi:hypothetical protein